MQFGTGDATVKGWDDVDVEAALDHLQTIESLQFQRAEYDPIYTTLLATIVVITTAHFIWHAVGPFLPTSRQLAGED